MQLDTGLHGETHCELFMQSVKQIQDDIRVRYTDLIEVEYPRFSDAEMSRRQAVMVDIVSAQQLDALIVVEAMRAGTATGWITGWPVTAEAVTLILPGARCRLFIQHFNHLPLARRLAWNAEVLWADVSATQQAADAIARATTGSARVGVIGRLPIAQATVLASRFQLVDVNRAYTSARLVKSEEEVRWLSLGADLTDLAVTSLAEGARPGMDERQLSAMVQASYLALGGTNFIHYFNSTAMGSPDVAVPRQFPSGRKLATGDILSCELSVDYWGYTGQILRSFFIGCEPNALYHELHAVADEVLDTILALIRPGVHARELVAASQRIEDAGFTIIDDLVHGYGGGYLPPVLGTASRPAAGAIPDLTLQAGMALVVQPNVVTMDGKAGVQTGQLLLVTENGTRSLQQFPRGFHVL